jgi:hypothetical protein
MARTRLFRSIVVFGTSLGAGASVVAVTLAPACTLYLGPGDGHGIIDAAIRPDACPDDACPDAWPAIADAPPDAWYGIIDASVPDAWPVIADAPLPPDAGADGGQSS